MDNNLNINNLAYYIIYIHKMLHNDFMLQVHTYFNFN